jgi:hypothetical protein
MDRIKRWWKYEGRYYLWDLRYGIKNLIAWFKVIWKDRNWDHSYFLEILQFKLKRQLHYWEKLTPVTHEGMESDIRLMKVCIKLIDIIKNESYSDKAFDEVESRWGESHWRFEPWTGPNPDEPREGLTQLFMDRSKVLTKEDKEAYDVDYKKTMDAAYAKEAKANRLLFYIIEQRLKHWWI